MPKSDKGARRLDRRRVWRKRADTCIAGFYAAGATCPGDVRRGKVGELSIPARVPGEGGRLAKAENVSDVGGYTAIIDTAMDGGRVGPAG